MTSEMTGPEPAVPVQRSLAWIDAARVAAILAVISIHVVAPLVTNRALPENSWFGNVVDSAARWSVPLFVMISGALLLHSDLADDPLAFYRRRLSRILPPLVAWTAIYLVIGHFLLDNPGTVSEAVYSVLAGRPFSHLYFLYLIAGLYLIAPFLRPLVAFSDRKVLGTAAALFLALGIADELIVAWGGIGRLNAVTQFVPYVGYFLAGAWLIGLAPTRRRIAWAATVVLAGILATALGSELLIDRFGIGQGLYLYEYLSVTTVPVSLAVLLLFRWSAPAIDRLAARLPRGWLSSVAASTLGIYVIHPLVLGGIERLGLGARAFLVPLAVPVTVLATFGVSLLIILVLRRLPALRRLV